MSIKKANVIRAFGKVLFLLYVGFLVYFLFVAEWYGRTEVSEDYRYNLELFKEIKRFITYREQLGIFAVFANLFRTAFLSPWRAEREVFLKLFSSAWG